MSAPGVAHDISFLAPGWRGKAAVAVRDPEQDTLAELLAEVRRTRSEHDQTRGVTRASTESLRDTSLGALGALEAYARALDGRGWPVPPRMQLDLRLLRALCGRTASVPPRR